MNNKIASQSSDCQHQIEDNFWRILKEKPHEYFLDDKVNDDKIREAYKFSARTLGVRIY